MLSVRAFPLPSNSVFGYGHGGAIGIGDDLNCDWQKKRCHDGNLKGLGLGLGFDASCAAPANSNFSNGVAHQRPRAFVDALGRDSRVSQFPSEMNHNLGSHYPPQQACPIRPSPDLAQSSQNLLIAKGRDGNFQIPCQPVMPVPSVALRPHSNMHNPQPPPHPVPATVALQNRRNQGHFIPNDALHLRGEALPPLPPCPPPPHSRGILPFQNPCPVVSRNQPGISAYSGLISSLVDQGVLSLKNQIPPKESIGVEFKADLLKVRHEAVIHALYGDRPRQCATCGRRFKCQEEHRRHMDGHVTKNRMSKNRKQKPSRKWFVNLSMLFIAAEALGTDAVPKLLSAETVVEKKISDEEIAVLADEDQSSCALCGDRFDDFYSHETGMDVQRCCVLECT